MNNGHGREGVAVVLAGAGARGAYEAGALSVLLPAMEAEGKPATVFVGTSAGAINAVGFASLLHLGAERASAAVLDLWRQVGFGSVFRLRPRRGGLLDTTPLAATLDRLIEWPQLHANVRSGVVSAVAVVATSCSEYGTTVFVEHPPTAAVPPQDFGRDIGYLATPLESTHVRASSAIPLVFPPTRIDRPSTAADWYVDGGVRLNTPIKPALAMNAARVVVIATAASEPPPRADPNQPLPAPGLAAGARQMIYALLADRMVEDLRTLARRNDEAQAAAPDQAPGAEIIPWIFAGPSPHSADGLGATLTAVLTGTIGTTVPGNQRGPITRVARKSLGRWLATDRNRADIASYLFFDPDFIDESIRLGQRDARISLDTNGRPAWNTGPTSVMQPRSR